MSNKHLTINERCCIYQFKNFGMGVSAIAKALHRSPSTISREIKLNLEVKDDFIDIILIRHNTYMN